MACTLARYITIIRRQLRYIVTMMMHMVFWVKIIAIYSVT